MTIGEALKECRIKAGMDQKEMSAGIVSQSFYSKVERGVHGIDTDLLIKILNKHDISVVTFFQMVNKKDNRNLWSLIRKLTIATNYKDISSLKEVLKEAKETKCPEWFIRNIESNIVMMTHSNASISEETKEHMKKTLLNEEWNSFSYAAFSRVMYMLDFKDAYELINSAYRAYDKNSANDMEEAIICLCAVNFLRYCYFQKADEKYIKTSVDFIHSIPASPLNVFAGIFSTYFKALIEDDQETVKEARDLLTKSGSLSLVKDTL